MRGGEVGGQGSASLGVGILGPNRAIFRWLAVLAAAIFAASVWMSTADAQRRPTGAQAQARAAASARGGAIANVRIEGIQRIEAETVRSYLLLHAGDAWDADRVDRSL